AEWPRKEFFYWSDDGDLTAMRYDRWKLVFKEQKANQFRVWMEPFVDLRVPLIFDLRMDPFEKASVDANAYYEWLERVAQFLAVPAQAYAGDMIATFKDYPPRQRPSKFNLDDVMSDLTRVGEGK
ncbi:MAG: arylsulfatase, partial [Bacteroidota bacterium]